MTRGTTVRNAGMIACGLLFTYLAGYGPIAAYAVIHTQESLYMAYLPVVRLGDALGLRAQNDRYLFFWIDFLSGAKAEESIQLTPIVE